MTPLRQRMIEDMQLRNSAPGTQRSYVHYVAQYAPYFNRSPELLAAEAIHQYLGLVRQFRPTGLESADAGSFSPILHRPVALSCPFGREMYSRFL